MPRPAKKKAAVKYVRIDHRTVIEVPVDISEQEARDNHIEKIKDNRKKFDNVNEHLRWKQ